MAKPVTSGILSTGPFPSLANITPPLTLVEAANRPLPSSPTGSPREILTLENRVVVLKKSTALDIAHVKKLMREAREQITQNHQAEGITLYQKVSELISSSMLDTKALLISVSCYILLANFSRNIQTPSDHFLEKARVNLKEIVKKLWDPTCPERKNCSFMYSLGCAQLAIYYNSPDSGPHQKTMNYFDAAIKLLSKASSESLKHRVFLGQCLAYLYDVRRTITANGTHCEREELIKKLNLARDFLERSLKFCTVDYNLQYLHALIRSMNLSSYS
jgi:hypothetical protein